MAEHEGSRRRQGRARSLEGDPSTGRDSNRVRATLPLGACGRYSNGIRGRLPRISGGTGFHSRKRQLSSLIPWHGSSTMRITRPGGDERSSSDTQSEIDCCWSRSSSGATLYESSAHGKRPEMSGRTTKKASSRKSRAARNDVRREYRLDYAKSRPNRFASMLKGRTTAVVLDPDVASVFRSPESVNRLLRSVIAALPGGVKPSRRAG